MKIIIYGTTWCPSCVSAKRFFDEMNLSYDEINIEKENISREQLAEMTGGHTVPQIVINDKCIGGFSDLLSANQSGKLEDLLSSEK